jgi:preprotein translocase subunit SecD
MSTRSEANDTALLLRAGALAAPMEIIEERTIGPSLGADNIEKGFNSTLYGFIAIAVFMIVYYAAVRPDLDRSRWRSTCCCWWRCCRCCRPR